MRDCIIISTGKRTYFHIHLRGIFFTIVIREEISYRRYVVGNPWRRHFYRAHVAAYEASGGQSQSRDGRTFGQVEMWRDLLNRLDTLPTTGVAAGDEGVKLLATQLRDRLGVHAQAPAVDGASPPH